VLARGRTLTDEDVTITGEARPREQRGTPLDDAVRQRTAQILATEPGSEGHVHERLIADVERVLLTVALESAGGNQVRAAQILGINRNTLRKKLTDLGIPIPHGAGSPR